MPELTTKHLIDLFFKSTLFLQSITAALGVLDFVNTPEIEENFGKVTNNKSVLFFFIPDLNILKSSPSTSIFLIGSLFFIILRIKIGLYIEFHFKNTI